MSNQPTEQPTEQPEQADACIHCGQTRQQHSSETLACVKAGYYGNRFTSSLNATVTIAFGDADPITVTLDGPELATDSGGGWYLSNASRDFIATEVEHALISLLTAHTLRGN